MRSRRSRKSRGYRGGEESGTAFKGVSREIKEGDMTGTPGKGKAEDTSGKYTFLPWGRHHVAFAARDFDCFKQSQ